MKLKKIASLALAGVMAVSMLAGCATTKPETKPVDPDQPATGVSTSVGALIKDVPEYVTFADSSKLDGALDYTMEWAGAKFVLGQYVNQENLDEVMDKDMAAAMADKLGTTKETILTIGDIDNKTNGASAVAYQLYAVSGTKGEDAVKKMVADELDDVVKSYKKYDLNGDNWDYAYTVSVSIDSKTVNSVGVGGVDGGIHGDGNVVVVPGMGVVVGGSVNGGIHGGSTSAANPTVTFVAVQVVRSAVRQ